MDLSSSPALFNKRIEAVKKQIEIHENILKNFNSEHRFNQLFFALKREKLACYLFQIEMQKKALEKIQRINLLFKKMRRRRRMIAKLIDTENEELHLERMKTSHKHETEQDTYFKKPNFKEKYPIHPLLHLHLAKNLALIPERHSVKYKRN